MKKYYHLKAQEDLHFYMVRVDQNNHGNWYDWAQNYNLAQPNAGVVGFMPSLACYNNNKTEIYVSYAANKELKNPTIPSEPIEMVVTMATSENAGFSSHMGIFRVPGYSGPEHKALSMTLHSFTAKATLLDHPGYEYMITNPVAGMREILLKEAAEKNIKVFLGTDHNTRKPEASLEELEKKYQEMLDGNGRCKKDFNKDVFHICSIELALLKQAAADPSPHCPFEISTKREVTTTRLAKIQPSYDKATSVKLKKADGSILCHIKEEDMTKNGEFAWFFHTHVYKLDDLYGPMVTTDIKGLAGVLAGEVETFSYIE